jgi:hypothetical protein
MQFLHIAVFWIKTGFSLVCGYLVTMYLPPSWQKPQTACVYCLHTSPSCLVSASASDPVAFLVPPQRTTFLSCLRKVNGSRLGRDTDYPDIFRLFLSYSIKIRAQNFKLRHDTFGPNHSLIYKENTKLQPYLVSVKLCSDSSFQLVHPSAVHTARFCVRVLWQQYYGAAGLSF